MALVTLILSTLVGVKLYAYSVLVGDVNDFEDAVEAAQAGDTIVLKNGEWNSVELAFYANGAKDNPVVLIAETPGKVILSGNSRLRIYGEYLEVNGLDFSNGFTDGSDLIEFRRSTSQLAHNCRLTNTRIYYYNPDSKLTEYKWVSVYGTNNRVDHCHFEGKTHEGALLVIWLKNLDEKPNYHQIDHNYFGNIPAFGDNGAEAMRIGTSDYSMNESHALVEYNLFESCDGEIEIISNKSCFNVYRFNTFRNNNGCLTLRHGNDCEVYNNFFFGGKSGSGGVRIIGERHKVYNNYFQDLDGDGYRSAICLMNGVPDSPLNRYFQVKDALVAHNTIVNCDEPLTFGAGEDDEKSLPPINCIISNNLITKTKGSKSVVYDDTPINVTYTSNFIFDNNVGVSDDGIINVDPELELEDSLWKVSLNSPVIDASAITYVFASLDIDFQERDSKPDVGCDEYSSEKINNVPLTKELVGVQWNTTNSSVHTNLLNNIRFYNDTQTIFISNINEDILPFHYELFNLNGARVQKGNILQSLGTIHLNGKTGLFFLAMRNEQNIYLRHKILIQ